MHSKVNSVYGDYYCQLFGNKKSFVKAYPMENKLYFHEALDKFVKDYGVTNSMIYDVAQE